MAPFFLWMGFNCLKARAFTFFTNRQTNQFHNVQIDEQNHW